MKKGIWLVFLALILTGCMGSSEELDTAMQLRAKLLTTGCSFDTTVTADYGDKIYDFTMQCEADLDGNLSFSVLEPETIAGITGTVSQDGGKLTFDDTALCFDTMADDLITPVSAPWVLVNTLRSGYVTACGNDGGSIRVSIDDSYEDDALHLDIWLDEGGYPDRAEILWKDRRILTLEIENFAFL